MLAIKPSPRNPHQAHQSKRLHPNLLPCSIHHSGPIKISKRYWSPTTTTPITNPTALPDDDGTKNSLQTAHFRGRKLQGRKIRLPKGYIGRILQKPADEDKASDVNQQHSQRQQQQQQRGHEGTAENAGEEGAGGEEDGDVSGSTAPVGMLETRGTFDALTIWEHEYAPLEGEEDGFARGIGEWIGFAEAVSFSSSFSFLFSFWFCSLWKRKGKDTRTRKLFGEKNQYESRKEQVTLISKGAQIDP
ncbi:hypothetical protein D0862_15046 [Hortaea werneckii]|uniref:Uncharacterized protein n=1 Tax=Hortaea werneckii TaxID=91943 RepID=A0A3M7DU74_HORWE|nr:hypothetical protein D0862_15046 [Hortaea werneckii]